MIPTAADFANAHGKGPNINKVTLALRDFWDAQGNANRTVQQDVVAHQLLISECKAWIKLKDAKSDFKKAPLGGHTNYINTKFTGRRTAIAKIVEEATQDLLVLLRQNNLLQADMRGHLSFDIRKYREKAHQRAVRHGTKGLAEGYRQERETWLKSGKSKAISGSKIHGIITDGGLRNPLPLSRSQQGALDSILTKHGGSASDWKILSEVEKIGDLRVAFLTKSKRYQFMAYISNGLFYDASDVLVDTNGEQVLWAMDSYGNMFIFEQIGARNAANVNIREKKHHIHQVNHSSINSGKEVICAGMIQVDNGQVSYLSNTSGHYKPTPQNLAEAMRILTGEGLDLAAAEVRTVRFPGLRPGRAWWQLWNVNQFITSNGTLGLISEEDGPQP